MAPRPRSTKNRDLPANLYRDRNCFRYRNPITGDVTSLGSDKRAAVDAAHQANAILVAPNDLLGAILGRKLFGEFADQFMADKKKPNGKPLAEKSKTTYTQLLTQCKAKWEKLPIDGITLLMMNEHLDSLSNGQSNQTRGLLIELFELAISKGITEFNPAAATLRKPQQKKVRKRHTVEGLSAVRAVCDPWLQNAIDLAMLTTQRRVDIVKMKWTDIYDGYLHVAQEKTTDDLDDDFEVGEGAGYVRIKVDAELQAVLDRCKADNVISPFLIHRVPLKKRKDPSKEHWTQVAKSYLTTAFNDALKRSNAYPKYESGVAPTFHEIRALSIFLHKKANKNAKQLAGHSTQQMTDRYASGHEIIWNNVEVGIKLPY